MAVETRMLLQPCPHIGMIMRTVVVQDHMNGQSLGSFTVDLPEEPPEFDVAMPRITRTDNLSLQYIQCRKQAGGPVAFGSQIGVRS